jgi:hypothetical protein
MSAEKESKTLQPIVLMVEQPTSQKPVPVRPHLRQRIRRTLAVPQHIKDKKARKLKAREPPPEFKQIAEGSTTLADYLESMDRAAEQKVD